LEYLSLPDGAGYSTRDRVEEVLGAGPAGIVVIGRDRHLLLVPLMTSGQPDRPRDLADGAAVRQARLDKSGQYVGFVGLDGRVHLRSVGATQDLASAAAAPGEALAAVGTDRWLTLRGGGISLHTARGVTQFRTTVPAISAEVGGETIASESADGVEFLDASSGRPGATVSGLSTGSLSPDGERYVASGSGADRSWYVVDTGTGDRHVFPGRPPRARAVSMTWQDDDRFLVLFTDPRQPGNRIVSDCSVATGTCQERYNDAGNTLQIATR
jgi:WD40 repeat protein